MKPKIVYVDDIENNLIAFEGLFEDDWDVTTFSIPTNALVSLPKIGPAIIVSDQKMPGMTGIQFFEQAIGVVPYAMRVLITGFSDEGVVIDAIKIAKVHDYIRKPCSGDEYVLRIQKVFASYKLLEHERRERERLLRENRDLNKRHEDLMIMIQDLKSENEKLKASKH
jgi:response regulator RpfG family c-di-GMP phosphodiesterase